MFTNTINILVPFTPQKKKKIQNRNEKCKYKTNIIYNGIYYKQNVL